MSLLSGFNVTLSDVALLGQASVAAFRNGPIPSGWTVVAPHQLGLASRYDDGNYFTNNGASAIVLHQGNSWIVSFRGTDGPDDIAQYPQLVSGTYINNFQPLMSAVATAAPSGSTFSFTGASLGGGATNLMATIATSQYDGKFASAKFVAFASPNISNASGILNIGFENDPVYKAINGYADFASSLDNLVLATAKYMDGNYDGRRPQDSYAHSASNGFEAFNHLSSSIFLDQMSPDSVIVLDAFGGRAQDTTPGREATGVFYIGENGSDEIVGRGGADHLEGFGGDDDLQGGAGDDVLAGGLGADRLTGGAGSDRFVFDRTALQDGGSGNIDRIRDFTVATDVLDVSRIVPSGESLAATVRVTHESGDDYGVLQVDRDGAAGSAGWVSVARIDNLHVGDAIGVLLTSGETVVTVSDGPSRTPGVIHHADEGEHGVSGSDGDDILVGNDTDNMIGCGDGDDHANGGRGNDVIFGGGGNDELGGGDGDDVIVGDDGRDVIFGEGGNDHANGGRGEDIMVAGAGDDVFGGGTEDDVLVGQAGNDLLFGEDGNDSINGGSEDDGLIGGVGNDQLGGGDGNDMLIGDDGDDTIFGEAGDDRMNGGFGNDVLLGGDGDDTCGGGAGDDNLQGGAGNDTLFGENGNDFLTGSRGDDVLVGMGNHDIFVFRPGDGADTVLDFTAGGTEDAILLQGTSLTSFAAVLAAASYNPATGATTITYNGTDTITLKFVSPSQLTVDDFIFT